MMVHDALYASTQFLLVHQITHTNYAEEEDLRNQGYFEGDQYHQGEYSTFTLIDRAERNSKAISALSEVCRIYYIVLFIYAQILYYQEGSDCADVAPTTNTLVLVYIILGYLYIGIPIIVLILACLCMPVLIFFSIIFARRRQIPATTVAISKLPVIKFNGELAGSHECSICMTDYVENDEIIQLKCSPMHHFHGECLKKWLNINGLCPICRARIEAAPESVVSPTSVEMRQNNSP